MTASRISAVQETDLEGAARALARAVFVVCSIEIDRRDSAETPFHHLRWRRWSIPSAAMRSPNQASSKLGSAKNFR
jgi:hypothetical protein